jgi:hypothetical protein
MYPSEINNHSKDLNIIQRELKAFPAYANPVIQHAVDKLDPFMLRKLWDRAIEEIKQWKPSPSTMRKKAAMEKAGTSGVSRKKKQKHPHDKKTSMKGAGTSSRSHDERWNGPDDNETPMEGAETSVVSHGDKSDNVPGGQHQPQHGRKKFMVDYHLHPYTSVPQPHGMD